MEELQLKNVNVQYGPIEHTIIPTCKLPRQYSTMISWYFSFCFVDVGINTQWISILIKDQTARGIHRKMIQKASDFQCMVGKEVRVSPSNYHITLCGIHEVEKVNGCYVLFNTFQWIIHGETKK